MSQPDDLVAALAPVVAILNDLGVGHYVGGSVASSFHGAVRSTIDVDIICDLKVESIAPILKHLGVSTEGRKDRQEILSRCSLRPSRPSVIV